MLFEEHILWLLVVHTILAFTAVFLSTHLCFWLRPYLRGQGGSARAVRRFALWATCAYGMTMLVGLALYPTYKVRVRGQYLEHASAITRSTEVAKRAEATAERQHLQSLAHRAGGAGNVPPPAVVDDKVVAEIAEQRVARGARMAAWFDVKEHWAALGFLLSAAVCFMVRNARPVDGQKMPRIIMAMAVTVAALGWAAAVIGILTAAARSVGTL